jgi:hypothetical protein
LTRDTDALLDDELSRFISLSLEIVFWPRVSAFDQIPIGALRSSEVFCDATKTSGAGVSAEDKPGRSSSRIFPISGRMFVRSGSNQGMELVLAVVELGLSSDIGGTCVEETISTS